MRNVVNENVVGGSQVGGCVADDRLVGKCVVVW